ncbi:transmembrane protein 68-like [Hemicordylus capensis]|uniref:transmembrane protein 68-like n=1 Tax=Hemicordylus capensis TaxID=884348 RepID=UPI0023025482|nr:transmembrane protein 68-like [Hemicordylus capensis]
MIATSTINPSEQDTMTWFAHMLKNWIGFAYLKEYLGFMFQPFWLLVLILLLYALPIVFCSFLCVLSLLLYVYKIKNNITEDPSSKVWDNVRHLFLSVVHTYGRILYGHEIIGMENIPEGPGIIIFYHGYTDSDYFFLLARLYLERGRLCRTVTDYHIYLIPGMKQLLNLFHCTCGSKDECVEILKQGDLLAIAPGGGREAIFSENYELLWGNRKGFADVALKAKVPLIPMFTQNINESFRTYGKTRLIRWLYDNYARFIFLPLYGGFPVKLRTYIGEPIPYDPNTTVEELAAKTKLAVENLRDRCQKRPGSIIRALLERFDKHHKDD